jgi:hypothetical protein
MVPTHSPTSDIIYLASSMNFWDPGPSQNGTDGSSHDLPMQIAGKNLWELTLSVPTGEHLEYKYTRGAWGKVEKGRMLKKYRTGRFQCQRPIVFKPIR